MGPVELRGLPEPVHLFQLLPRRLSERAFPPLRLDKAAEHNAGAEMNPTEEPSASASHTGDQSDAKSYASFTGETGAKKAEDLANILSRGQPEQRVAQLLFAYEYTNALLSVMRPAERQAQLTTLRNAWRVHSDARLRGYEASLGSDKVASLALANRVVATMRMPTTVVDGGERSSHDAGTPVQPRSALIKYQQQCNVRHIRGADDVELCALARIISATAHE